MTDKYIGKPVCTSAKTLHEYNKPESKNVHQNRNQTKLGVQNTTEVYL